MREWRPISAITLQALGVNDYRDSDSMTVLPILELNDCASVLIYFISKRTMVGIIA